MSGNRTKYCAEHLDKIQQSIKLSKLFRETGDRFVIEAADYDPIFVIQLSEYSSDLSWGCEFKDESFDIPLKDWIRKNLLGITLIKVPIKDSNFCKALILP